MKFGNESEQVKEEDSFACCCSITAAFYNIDKNPTIPIISCIFNIPISVTTTLANILVLFSIWRTPSLHSPSNVLLVSLALSDLGVGIVVQPIFLVYCIAKIKRLAGLFCSITVALSMTGYCLCGVSLLTLTAISLDRYIAVHIHLRYNEIVTVKRVTTIVFVIWLCGVVNGTSLLWSSIFDYYSFIVVMFFSISVTTFAYCKIYRVVRRHQAQIQSQLQIQVVQQEGSSLDMPQFKKSFWNMVLIYCVFLFCYFPVLAVRAVISTTERTVSKQSAFELALLFLYLNSTLNPLIYCWRFQQIRVAVLETISYMILLARANDA